VNVRFYSQVSSSDHTKVFAIDMGDRACIPTIRLPTERK
jgi:hypothetical protein